MSFPVTRPLLLGLTEQGQRPQVAPGQQSPLALRTLGSTGSRSRPSQQFGVTLTTCALHLQPERPRGDLDSHPCHWHHPSSCGEPFESC